MKRIALSLLLLAVTASLFAGDAYPPGTVMYFNRGDCPSGWSLYANANGFSIVAVSPPATIGQQVSPPVVTPTGSNRHAHNFTASFRTGSIDYAGSALTGDQKVAEQQTVTVTPEAQPTSANIPTVMLLVCVKNDNAEALAAAPANIVTFRNQTQCASGWSIAAMLNGYLLVGMREGAAGVAFGGEPLAPGERREHTHTVKKTVGLENQDKALDEGCCAHNYAKSGEYGLSATTTLNTADFPYVQLLPCQPSGTP